jgi:hypothetical protein
MCWENSLLRSFALRMEEVHQVFNFVRLENISEGRHRSATPANLTLDSFFL